MADEIWIIRHGETDANAARVVQRPGAPLSRRGEEQALRLARRAAVAGIERVLASDLARARRTAEILRDATGAALHLDDTLQERNFGDLRGTPYAQLGGRNIFAHDFEPPGGESGAAFEARVALGWGRVRAHAAETGGRLAVVTHGLVCAALLTHHLTSEATAPGGWGNTSVTIVSGRAPWSVLLANCTAHLDGDRAVSGGPV